MNKKQVDNGWPITAERFVAFIDIMGFKDLIMRSTHNQVYKMMRTINEQRRHNADIQWLGITEKLIRTMTYSDSIMIYSKDDSTKSFDSISNTISGLSYDLFIEGIPHKGALAFGTMTIDSEDSIFFGQPLIDSYLLQEELSFYGVLLHGSVEKKIYSSKYDIGGLFIKDYICPLKNGASHHLTIFPMFLDESENSKYKQNQKELFEAIIKFRHGTSGHLRKYIDNTENYFKFISSS